MNLWPVKSDNCTHWTVLHSFQRTFQWCGENQTAGTASNCATYSPDDHMWPIADFTLCTVTVTVSLTWCECGCGCGNGCHDNSNGACQDDAWQSVKLILCWSSEPKSERWLQEIEGEVGFGSWEKDYWHMGRYRDDDSATQLFCRLWWRFRTYPLSLMLTIPVLM